MNLLFNVFFLLWRARFDKITQSTSSIALLLRLDSETPVLSMQLDKSTAPFRIWSAFVLANRIQMWSFGKSFSRVRFSFLFPMLLRSMREESDFLSSHRMLFFYFSFFLYWVLLDFPFSKLYYLCWSSFRSILSQFFRFFSPWENAPYPYSPKSCIHWFYIACGVWLILPEPFRLGKEKSYWKFSIGWRLFRFPPLRLFSLSIAFRCFVCSLFGPVI